MSTGHTIMHPFDSEKEELHTLVPIRGSTNKQGPLQRLLLHLDEKVSVKLLLRLWGPRLEFVVRLLLIATFLDDSLHSALHFSESAVEITEQGCFRILVKAAPQSASLLATVTLALGIMIQFVGALSLLVLYQVGITTGLLIGWTMAQPVVYAQVSNFHYIAASLSLVGGLLMLQEEKGISSAHTKLIGRLLLPMVYVYDAGKYLLSAVTLDETHNLYSFLSSLSMFVVNSAVLVGLVLVCSLVAVGLKSRTIALLLALINIIAVFYQHPFFMALYLEDNEWKVKDTLSIPDIALPDNVALSDLDIWDIYNFHRYYFFLGLSTTGALLLLAQFGPGKISVQEKETLLPHVNRAQD